jgi:hypothetical protein
MRPGNDVAVACEGEPHWRNVVSAKALFKLASIANEQTPRPVRGGGYAPRGRAIS